MSDFDKELDTSGLNCPLPIIKAKKEINTMETGQILHVISTDPGAVMDFESFAGQSIIYLGIRVEQYYIFTMLYLLQKISSMF
jgi:tRNA 2-thiouridine synthesizing protein A